MQVRYLKISYQELAAVVPAILANCGLATVLRPTDKSEMRWVVFTLALSCFLAADFAGVGAADPVSTNRALTIDQSFMKVAGGKATLTIGLLRRTNDIYGGDFQMKVSPWFFKSEKGTLAIVVTDESIAKAARGLTVEITGTATADGKKKVVRQIEAVATPVDENHGTLKLWFMVDERKMVFATAYRFVD